MDEKQMSALQGQLNQSMAGHQASPPFAPTLSPPPWKEGSPEWQRALAENGGNWPEKR